MLFDFGRIRYQAVGICAALGALMLAGSVKAADSVDVEHGKYLVTIGICAGCHTPLGPDFKHIEAMRLAGGGRAGPLNTPNLTPDVETGLGSWTDDQVVSAIRNGKRPDGSSIRPPMGVFFYRDLSDHDAKSIVAYLKSLPPIKNKVARSPVTIPAPSFTPVESVAEPNAEDRGKYLAITVGHCMQCHTPRGANGLPDLSRVGMGGNTLPVPGGGTVVTPNLTPGNPDGIVQWTDEQVKKIITHGERPDGSTLLPNMDFEMYAEMTPEDLTALVKYLRSLKPIASN
ncbi:MAG: cytochrome [Rhizobium sp.]|jgi:mono/diheme cytochrome c family protein|nr:cytochrome [Rhizobium sp.]